MKFETLFAVGCFMLQTNSYARAFPIAIWTKVRNESECQKCSKYEPFNTNWHSCMQKMRFEQQIITHTALASQKKLLR